MPTHPLQLQEVTKPAHFSSSKGICRRLLYQWEPVSCLPSAPGGGQAHVFPLAPAGNKNTPPLPLRNEPSQAHLFRFRMGKPPAQFRGLGGGQAHAFSPDPKRAKPTPLFHIQDGPDPCLVPLKDGAKLTPSLHLQIRLCPRLLFRSWSTISCLTSHYQRGPSLHLFFSSRKQPSPCPHSRSGRSSQ